MHKNFLFTHKNIKTASKNLHQRFKKSKIEWTTIKFKQIQQNIHISHSYLRRNQL